MGYNKKRTTHIDLSEFGTDGAGNGFFANIVDMKSMTLAEKMRYVQTGRTASADLNQWTEEMTALLPDFVIAWNLIDMNTEEPLSPKDEGAFNRIPGDVTDKILKEISAVKVKDAEEVKN
jgi:hypothetical protein